MTMNKVMQSKIATMLSIYLGKLGFTAMANECKKETNIDTLRKYARVVAVDLQRNYKQEVAKEVTDRLRRLALI